MSGQDAATATTTTMTMATLNVGVGADGDGDGGGGNGDQQRTARGIGASVPPADTRAKAEGTFPYAADLWAEGLLWAAVLRSPHAHARIRSIDTTAAAEMPGVRAVITHADVPGATTHGRRIADRPVFAHDVVRHHGEPIPPSPPTTPTRPASRPPPSPSSTSSSTPSPTPSSPSAPPPSTRTAT